MIAALFVISGREPYTALGLLGILGFLVGFTGFSAGLSNYLNKAQET